VVLVPKDRLPAKNWVPSFLCKTGVVRKGISRKILHRTPSILAGMEKRTLNQLWSKFRKIPAQFA